MNTKPRRPRGRHRPEYVARSEPSFMAPLGVLWVLTGRSGR